MLSHGGRGRVLPMSWMWGSDLPGPQSSMTRKSIGKVKASQFKKLKPGLRLTINQGFRKLRRMASALDISECEVAEVLETLALHLEENIEIASRDREVFIGELAIPEEPLVQEVRAQPLVGETFTDAEPVKRQAELRGHHAMKSLSLSTGYDFFLSRAQKAALEEIDGEKPYCEILAFPCGPWSPLQNLRKEDEHAAQMEEVATPAFGALCGAGRHFLIENPSRSAAWQECEELQSLAQDPRTFLCQVDQCMLGLRGPRGGLHRKRTWLLTSLEIVAQRMCNFMCDGTHEHEPVIGGSGVTEPAGHFLLVSPGRL